MRMSRRSWVLGAAAASVSAGLPMRSIASLSAGDTTLTTVSDGHLVLPGALVFEPMPQAALTELLARFDVSPAQLTPECNLALYRDGVNTVLFDTGAGAAFMPSAGQLGESLSAIELDPGDVTHVVFTHAHPDHIWGLLDDFDDLMFYNAEYFMGRTEWEYWWDPATVETIGAARTTFAVGARRRMEAIADRINLVDDGAEVLPGVAAVASFGHTPGHMCFEVALGSDTALVLGDAIGNHHVAFARPGWNSGSDQDPAMAAMTRARLFQKIMAERMTVVGFHLPKGGIGRVDTWEDAYRFEPL